MVDGTAMTRVIRAVPSASMMAVLERTGGAGSGF
jgi:hypothetical protein